MSWEVKKLGDVAKIGAGNSAPQDKKLFINGVHPFFRTSDIGNIHIGNISAARDLLNDKGIKKLKLYPVGTILIPKSGASTFLNHRVILDVEGYVSSHLATVICDEELLEKRFAFYYLTKIKAQNIVQDHSYPSLKLADIKEINIPVPPLEEQKQIVAKLDQCFKEIDKAKANTAKNLENAKALFQSKLNESFSQKGEEWVEKNLGDVLNIKRGGSPRPIKKYLTDDPDGLNWIKIGDATASDKYIYKTKQKITKDGLHKTRLVEEGDFILSNSMSFGKPYIMKTTGCIHDGWLTLKEKDGFNIDQDFLYHLLCSPNLFKQFDGLAAGSTVRNLNIALVSSVTVYIPPIDLQKTIVSSLEKIKKQTQSLESKYKQELNSLEELKKSILQKAFIGELTEVLA
jgi:type I restriction enzyme, S subunit